MFLARIVTVPFLCFNCFYCASYAHYLAPGIRQHLASHTDVFHWPKASSPNCSNLPADNRSIESQTCTKHHLCVTISPNIRSKLNNCISRNKHFCTSGTVMLLSFRCHLVSSTRELPMDYIVCVCEGNYCNNQKQHPFIRPKSLYTVLTNGLSFKFLKSYSLENQLIDGLS
ncbi:unnamed protein product [Enterobius vermicularis]|uniref:Activin_recp domain-containing protein n=1 Tax=Enterobius vermicularis TaxID=51028 RepID=A0A0N4VBN7_ENTVE|nr:unnamed protein product [Enterobius vermicularis]